MHITCCCEICAFCLTSVELKSVLDCKWLLNSSCFNSRYCDNCLSANIYQLVIPRCCFVYCFFIHMFLYSCKDPWNLNEWMNEYSACGVLPFWKWEKELKYWGGIFVPFFLMHPVHSFMTLCSCHWNGFKYWSTVRESCWVVNYLTEFIKYSFYLLSL
jgi:hypothetical protein